MNIKKFKQKYDLKKSAFKNAALKIGLAFSDIRDDAFVLNPNQIRELKKELKISEKQETTDSAKSESSPKIDLVSFKDDFLADFVNKKFSELKYEIHIHEDVYDKSEKQPQIKRRLRWVLKNFIISGTASIRKTCKGQSNEGWRRTPLGGGSNGMQYYLWWAVSGSPALKALEPPIAENNIVVRAIRHHNMHDTLKAESHDDLTHIDTRSDFEKEINKISQESWTDEQRSFINAKEPIRVIVGYPGAGKTIALQEAIMTRGKEKEGEKEKVLYITWSDHLAQKAKEHFALASNDLEIKTYSYSKFLSGILDTDVPMVTNSHSFDLFEEELESIDSSLYRSWGGRSKALYSEIRGMLLGRAVPGDEKSTIEKSGYIRLTSEKYKEERRDILEKVALDELLKVAEQLEKRDAMFKIFPDLFFAYEAYEFIRSGKRRTKRDSDNEKTQEEIDFPSVFLGIDRVVVDEAQDLTMVELFVLIALCHKLAKLKEGEAPFVLIAGDEGQTIRPSGFYWGEVNKALSRQFGRNPKEFVLFENLRCPTKIAKVVKNATELYGHISKGLRPHASVGRIVEQHVEANVVYATAQANEANQLLSEIKMYGDVAVITPFEECPEWVEEGHKDWVLKPAEMKGLEYQTVCILDSGKMLEQLEIAIKKAEKSKTEENLGRTLIDQFRVALSRATETLIFLDIEPTKEQKHLIRKLLNNPATLRIENIRKKLTRDDLDTEELIRESLLEIEKILDENPARAYTYACNAYHLLGNPSLPNGVTDMELREDTCISLLRTLLVFYISSFPKSVSESEVETLYRKIFAKNESLRSVKKALDLFIQWARDLSSVPFDMICEFIVLEKGSAAFSYLIQLKEKHLKDQYRVCAKDFVYSRYYYDSLESQLQFIGVHDVKDEAQKLREIVATTLYKETKVEDLRKLIAYLSEDSLYHAHLLYLEKQWGKAENIYVESLETLEATNKSELLKRLDVLNNLCVIALERPEKKQSEAYLDAILELGDSPNFADWLDLSYISMVIETGKKLGSPERTVAFYEKIQFNLEAKKYLKNGQAFQLFIDIGNLYMNLLGRAINKKSQNYWQKMEDVYGRAFEVLDHTTNKNASHKIALLTILSEISYEQEKWPRVEYYLQSLYNIIEAEQLDEKLTIYRIQNMVTALQKQEKLESAVLFFDKISNKMDKKIYELNNGAFHLFVEMGNIYNALLNKENSVNDDSTYLQKIDGLYDKCLIALGNRKDKALQIIEIRGKKSTIAARQKNWIQVRDDINSMLKLAKDAGLQECWDLYYTKQMFDALKSLEKVEKIIPFYEETEPLASLTSSLDSDEVAVLFYKIGDIYFQKIEKKVSKSFQHASKNSVQERHMGDITKENHRPKQDDCGLEQIKDTAARASRMKKTKDLFEKSLQVNRKTSSLNAEQKIKSLSKLWEICSLEDMPKERDNYFRDISNIITRFKSLKKSPFVKKYLDVAKNLYRNRLKTFGDTLPQDPAPLFITLSCVIEIAFHQDSWSQVQSNFEILLEKTALSNLNRTRSLKLLKMALISFTKLNQHEKALELYSQNENLFDDDEKNEANDHIRSDLLKAVGDIHFQLALSHKEENSQLTIPQFSTTEEFYKKSLTFLDKLSYTEAESKVEIFKGLYRIAYLQNHWEQAKHRLQKVLDTIYSFKLRNQHTFADIKAMIVMHEKLNEKDLILLHYDEMYKVRDVDNSEENEDVFYVFNAMGDFYLQASFSEAKTTDAKEAESANSMIQKAESAYEKALKSLGTLTSKNALASVQLYDKLSKMGFKYENWAKAEEMLIRFFNSAKAFDLTNLIRVDHIKMIFAVFKNTNKAKDIVRFYEDVLLSPQVKNRIKDLEFMPILEEAADVYWQNDTAKSFVIYKDIIEKITTKTDDETKYKIRLLRRVSEYLFEKEKWAEAESYLHELCTLNERLGLKDNLALNDYRRLILVLKNQNKLIDSLLFCEKLDGLLQDNYDKTIFVVELLYEMAMLYVSAFEKKIKSNYEEDVKKAISLYDRALTVVDEVPDSAYIEIEIRNKLSTLSRQQGNWGQAELNLIKILQINKRLRNESVESLPFIANAILVFKEQNKLENAINLYEIDEANIKKNIVTFSKDAFQIFDMMADIYCELQMPQKAEDSFQHALNDVFFSEVETHQYLEFLKKASDFFYKQKRWLQLELTLNKIFVCTQGSTLEAKVELNYRYLMLSTIKNLEKFDDAIVFYEKNTWCELEHSVEFLEIVGDVYAQAKNSKIGMQKATEFYYKALTMIHVVAKDVTTEKLRLLEKLSTIISNQPNNSSDDAQIACLKVLEILRSFKFEGDVNLSHIASVIAIFKKINMPDEAIAFFEATEKVISPLFSDRKQECILLFSEMGDAYLRAINLDEKISFQKAKQLYANALELLEPSTAQTALQKLGVLDALCRIALKQNAHDQIAEYLEQMMTMIRGFSKKDNLPPCIGITILIALKRLNKITEGIQFYDDINLYISKKIKESENFILHSTMGDIYLKAKSVLELKEKEIVDNGKNAGFFYKKALADLGGTTSQNANERIEILERYSESLCDQKLWLQAENILNELFRLVNQVDSNSTYKPQCVMMMFQVFENLNKYENAISFYERDAKRIDSITPSIELVKLLQVIAGVYVQTISLETAKRTQLAISLYQKALNIVDLTVTKESQLKLNLFCQLSDLFSRQAENNKMQEYIMRVEAFVNLLMSEAKLEVIHIQSVIHVYKNAEMAEKGISFYNEIALYLENFINASAEEQNSLLETVGSLYLYAGQHCADAYLKDAAETYIRLLHNLERMPKKRDMHKIGVLRALSKIMFIERDWVALEEYLLKLFDLCEESALYSEITDEDVALMLVTLRKLKKTQAAIFFYEDLPIRLDEDFFRKSRSFFLAKNVGDIYAAFGGSDLAVSEEGYLMMVADLDPKTSKADNKAENSYTTALELVDSTDQAQNYSQAKILYSLSKMYFRRQKWSELEKRLREFFHLIRKFKLRDSLNFKSLQMFIVALGYLHKTQDATFFLEKGAFEIDADFVLKQEERFLLASEIGNSYFQQSKLTIEQSDVRSKLLHDACKFYEMALELCQQHPKDLIVQQLKALSRLCEIMTYLNKKKSHLYFEKMRDAFNQMESLQPLSVNNCRLIMRAYKTANKSEEALGFYLERFDALGEEKVSDKESLAYLLFEVGEIYQQLAEASFSNNEDKKIYTVNAQRYYTKSGAVIDQFLLKEENNLATYKLIEYINLRINVFNKKHDLHAIISLFNRFKHYVNGFNLVGEKVFCLFVEVANAYLEIAKSEIATRAYDYVALATSFYNRVDNLVNQMARNGYLKEQEKLEKLAEIKVKLNECRRLNAGF